MAELGTGSSGLTSIQAHPMLRRHGLGNKKSVFVLVINYGRVI